MFEDTGCEVYEGSGPEYPEEPIRPEIGAPARRAPTFKEILEGLCNRFYEFEEEVLTAYGDDPRAREDIINLWIKSLRRWSTCNTHHPTKAGGT
ncbi:hypothetical protein V1525DRAFT_391185 [Lipomyces kononenkoae]|uniref:Uncharacterized protein n=1 Tax=Lipomyces kononenkoae TaxID=34357 RepID=A0ACC3SSU6_LIPKO